MFKIERFKCIIYLFFNDLLVTWTIVLCIPTITAFVNHLSTFIRTLTTYYGNSFSSRQSTISIAINEWRLFATLKSANSTFIPIIRLLLWSRQFRWYTKSTTVTIDSHWSVDLIIIDLIWEKYLSLYDMRQCLHIIIYCNYTIN
jgi:hypothetical protein